mgnify:CR=1 FL=1
MPYRGYDLKELTLVPRPVNRPVECWQPVVSASARGLDFMVRHGIKGAVGGGAATMAEGPIQAYRDAAARAGKDLRLGENLTVGVFFYLADTREKAIRELDPILRGAREDVCAARVCTGHHATAGGGSRKRGGWNEAGVPTLDHYLKLGSWFAGTPQAARSSISRSSKRAFRAWSTST